MFEIPAVIPIKSPFCSPCTHWPSFGMYIFQGYTMVGVTLKLLIRLLACALGGDSGLPVTVSLCFHFTINCHLNSKVAQTNKNSKIGIEKVFKDR